MDYENDDKQMWDYIVDLVDRVEREARAEKLNTDDIVNKILKELEKEDLLKEVDAEGIRVYVLMDLKGVG